MLGGLSSYIGWDIILNVVDNLALGGLSSYTGRVVLLSSSRESLGSCRNGRLGEFLEIIKF